jgi:hypothetical protein
LNPPSVTPAQGLGDAREGPAWPAHHHPQPWAGANQPQRNLFIMPYEVRQCEIGVLTLTLSTLDVVAGIMQWAPRRAGRPLSDHLRILVTRPAPTVRPPSRIAKRRLSSIAMGWMSFTSMLVVSPGMTISVPSGSVTTPVTSVVRK